MVQPLVLLVAKMQRITASQTLIRLAVLVEIRRTNEGTAIRRAQEQDLAFAYTQKYTDAKAALVRVERARAYRSLVDFHLAAVALRAEHLAAN